METRHARRLSSSIPFSPLSFSDLKKAFTKVMRPEIAKHALYLFTGKHEDKLDTKKIGNEKLFEEVCRCLVPVDRFLMDCFLFASSG